MRSQRLAPLVVLKSKQGELTGLFESNRHENLPVLTMVEVLDSLSSTGGRTLPLLARSAAARAVAGRPVWVDCSTLTRAAPLSAVPQGPLQFLDILIQDELDRQQEMQSAPPLIPVLGAFSDETMLTWVKMLQEHHPRPIAVRLRKPRREHVELIVERLSFISTAARVPIDWMNVVVDLQYLPEFDDVLVGELVELLERLNSQVVVSSTTLLAGSVPRQRTITGAEMRVRAEWALWSAVQSHLTVPVRYGDYGVVHPVPIPSATGPVTVYPYLDYTLHGRSLCFRQALPRAGRKFPPRGSAARYFTKIADELVHRSEYAGEEFSWGDGELYKCRSGGGKQAAAVPRWLAMATSHHLAYLSRGGANESEYTTH